MQKISEQIKQQVKVLRENGYYYDKISEELSIGKGSVSNICKEFGLCQKIVELTPEKIIEVQKMYDEIGNIKEVASRLSSMGVIRAEILADRPESKMQNVVLRSSLKLPRQAKK